MVAKDVYPPQLPIVALPGRPLFPKTVTPIAVDTDEVARLMGTVLESQNRLLGLVLRRAEPEDEPPPSRQAEVVSTVPRELHRVGVELE